MRYGQCCGALWHSQQVGRCVHVACVDPVHSGVANSTACVDLDQSCLSDPGVTGLGLVFL